MTRAVPLVALLMALVVCGCGASGHTSSTAPQPPAVPGETTAGPDLSGVQLPNAVMPLIKGAISRPKTKLTPGAVSTTDATTVCTRPRHAAGPAPSAAMATAIYNSYGYTTTKQQFRYYLDMLVPWNLGGAVVPANIWPAATKGTGYYQKIQTDHILRDLVCRRSITLAQAQQALETNWYSAWLRYVVLAGHI